MKLFVSNFPFQTTERELRLAFEDAGTVEKTNVVMEAETGKPRGFGFVTMATVADGQRAIEQLDGSSFGGRTLRVAPAKDKGGRPSEGRDRSPREARW